MTSPPGRQLAPQLRDVTLTARERNVMIWISYGKTNSQIAGKVGATENTIKTYVRKLLERFGATDRSHLVRIGIECGIIPVDAPAFRAVITGGRYDRRPAIARLLVLQPAKAWNVKEVASALSWRADSARGGLERLAESGWVERVPHTVGPDRHRVYYKLTEMGQQNAKQLARAVTQASVDQANKLLGTLNA